jgi:hypothetical protein
MIDVCARYVEALDSLGMSVINPLGQAINRDDGDPGRRHAKISPRISFPILR